MEKKIQLDLKTKELVRKILEDVVNKLPNGYAITVSQLEDYVYKQDSLKGNKYMQFNSNYINACIGNFIKTNKLKKMNEYRLIDNIDDLFKVDGLLPHGGKIIIKN